MAKYTTALCKEKITEYVKANKAVIEAQFCLNTAELREDFEELYTEACKVKNWKRRGKSRVDVVHTNEEGATQREFDAVQREFDCVPFEDQLRAYVATDKTDTELLDITVQGE